MSLSPWLVLASLAPGAAAAGAAPLRQEQPRTVFRAETRVVYLDVLVERNGRAVTDLTSEDFLVLDDGERQELVIVEHDRIPLQLIVAADTSSSMAGAKLSHLESATRAAVEALDARDAVGLLTFSHQATLQQSPTTEHGLVLDALDAMTAHGATAWRDALFMSLATVNDSEGRPVVMLFTDGDDTYSWLSEEAVLGVAEETSALVYAVSSPGPSVSPDAARSLRAREADRQRRVQHRRRVEHLREVAEVTGGRLIETASTAELREAFLEIVREASTRYLLAFTPASPVREGWHDLEVNVQGRGITIHARRGYYFEPH